jgi:chorismate mutase / prephenate dehydrogenase
MSPDQPNDLDELRHRLDSIDNALLDLFCQRLGCVNEVAEIKAKSGGKLFHRSREEEMIAHRRSEANRRGVDPDLIENFFRRIVLSSHAVQSRVLLTSKPIEPKIISIIGGEGAMGSFFRQLFETLGHEVLIADLETPLTPVEAAARGDVVMVSVPIAATVEVIRQIGPHIKPGSCLLDVTSLKEEPVQAMLDSFAGEVVGVHPMFSPAVKSIHRQVVVICRSRGSKWADWLTSALESQGAEIVETTPEEHDRVMAIIQVLRHFASIAFGAALAALDTDLDQTLRFTSPIYRLELIMTGRLFSQDPALYADIIMKNPRRAEVMDAIEQTVGELACMVRNSDRGPFIKQFEDISQFFGDFKDRAMEESKYLIETMIERI